MLFIENCRYLWTITATTYMEKIGIFCSASENIDKMYFESARQIGEWMGQKGKTLIYGGASLGLMECVARAVKENGGKVIGVVPAKLEENGKVSILLDEEIHTRNLSERKVQMSTPLMSFYQMVMKRQHHLHFLPDSYATKLY